MDAIRTRQANDSGGNGAGRGLLAPLASLFLLSAKAASFEARGFPPGPEDRQRRLERIGAAFITGYNVALREHAPVAIADRIEATAPDLRGFVAEGAAMGVALKQGLGLCASLDAFLAKTDARHIYLTYVGIGWAMARLPFRRARLKRALSPLLCWLAEDGRGFHDLYFHHRRVMRTASRPRGRDYGARARDQGVGRGLWFLAGAQPARAADLAARFHESRREDLWAGLGLAAVYAGGAPREELGAMGALAGEHRPALAQGAAFAAEAAIRGGTASPRLDEACRVLTGLGAPAASRMVRDRLDEIQGRDAAGDMDDDEVWPVYEMWRRSLKAEFAARPTEKEGEHADLA